MPAVTFWNTCTVKALPTKQTAEGEGVHASSNVWVHAGSRQAHAAWQQSSTETTGAPRYMHTRRVPLPLQQFVCWEGSIS